MIKRTVLAVVLALTAGTPLRAEEDLMPDNNAHSAVATFAGGCFWCMEPPYDKVPGVLETTVGYTGGKSVDPTYEEVSTGRTGHYEAVQVRFDPSVVDYATLLQTFWRSIDPTDAHGQFADQGSQYQTAIFVHDDAQREAAKASKAALQASGKFKAPIATKILPADVFYAAEDYHQDYYRKQPTHYKLYSTGSGRKPFLERTWKGKETGEATP